LNSLQRPVTAAVDRVKLDLHQELGMPVFVWSRATLHSAQRRLGRGSVAARHAGGL